MERADRPRDVLHLGALISPFLTPQAPCVTPAMPFMPPMAGITLPMRCHDTSDGWHDPCDDG